MTVIIEMSFLNLFMPFPPFFKIVSKDSKVKFTLLYIDYNANNL